MSVEDTVAEVNRQFTICNACRYCEGFCAVFPAAELRTQFLQGDVSYLANLCHDCRACQQACMYTEPHEFALNIPQLLAQARLESYSAHARPVWLRRAFESGPLTLAALNVAAVAVVLVLIAALGSLAGLTHAYHGSGSLYRVVSHAAMAVPALLLTAYGAVVVLGGLLDFWRQAGGRLGELLRPRLWRTALAEVGSLRWMKGGGGDCYYPDDEVPSPSRRRLHQLVMYGFLAALLATIAAAAEEYLAGTLPPYPLLSVPVLLGLIGGVAMTIGSAGLLILKRSSPPELSTAQMAGQDVGFIVSLLALSITGLLLLAFRDSPAMGVFLAIHLGTVAAFYLTAPYGKFVHGVYRLGAILLNVREQAALEG